MTSPADRRVHATGEECQIDYRVRAGGGSLTVEVLADGPTTSPQCGPNDFATQRALLETAPPHRVEA